MPKSTKQEENDKALLDAARNGSVEEVRRSLLVGVDVNATDDDGATPLHCAALRGHAAIVNVLVQAGALVDAVNQIWQHDNFFFISLGSSQRSCSDC